MSADWYRRHLAPASTPARDLAPRQELQPTRFVVDGGRVFRLGEEDQEMEPQYAQPAQPWRQSAMDPPLGQMHALDAAGVWRGTTDAQRTPSGACPHCKSKDYMPRLPSGRLGHCFSGETEVLTYDGPQAIGDLAGTSPRLLVPSQGGGGRWKECEVRSFGVQPLKRITLSRNGVKKTIHATAEHEWFVMVSQKEGGRRLVRRTTEELLPKHRLASLLPRPTWSGASISGIGVAHGLVYGDGNRNGRGSEIRLWGKNTALLSYFPHQRTGPVTTDNGVEGIKVLGLPGYFKSRVPLEESTSYLLGWLAGYFAADGCVSREGQATLASASKEDLEFVRLLCDHLGIGTYGIKQQKRVGLGKGMTWLYSVAFMPQTLPIDFFLLSEAKRRIIESPTAYTRKQWSVVSVEDTERVEEVFCAVVPGPHAFALEDHLLTSNCFACGYRPDTGDDRGGPTIQPRNSGGIISENGEAIPVEQARGHNSRQFGKFVSGRLSTQDIVGHAG